MNRTGITTSHDIRRRTGELGVAPRKALGQHFLVSHAILQHILQAAELSPDDVVVEVGPGLGVLTDEIARRVRRLITIELDRKIASCLTERYATSGNVEVVWDDARTVDYAALLGSATTYKVVANLPYYAASPIIRRFLESQPKPRLMVVTVQKEVAQNMTAHAGQMSLLSVATQFYAHPLIVCYVPPRAFHPAPRVSSAVMRLDVYDKPVISVDSETGFFGVVRAGFCAPRKQLRNALTQGLGRPVAVIENILAQAGIDHKRRAETLTLQEWGKLCHAASR